MQCNYFTATAKYLTVLVYVAECKQRYRSHREKSQIKDVSNRWKCKARMFLIAGNAKQGGF